MFSSFLQIHLHNKYLRITPEIPTILMSKGPLAANISSKRATALSKVEFSLISWNKNTTKLLPKVTATEGIYLLVTRYYEMLPRDRVREGWRKFRFVC
jgi:hypothetical protein